MFDDVWEEIKKTVSLQHEMAKHGWDLRSGGNNKLKAVCRFHADTNPSCFIYINDEVESFYCHGCKVGGTVIDFIMKTNKIGHIGALDYFKRNYSLVTLKDVEITPEFIDRQSNKKPQERAACYVIYNKISRAIRKFILSTQNPKDSFIKIKQYLIEADEAFLIENYKYLVFLYNKLSEEIGVKNGC